MSGRYLAPAAILAIAGTAAPQQASTDTLSLEDALARQSATDLISGVSVAYQCAVEMYSMRQLGTEEQPVYLVQVSMAGSECEDALLLLARHGSTKNFVFRRWQADPDVQRIDPSTPPPESDFDIDSGEDGRNE